MVLAGFGLDLAAIGGYVGFWKHRNRVAARRASLMGVKVDAKLKKIPVLDEHFEAMTKEATAADRRAAKAMASFMRRIVAYRAFDFIMVSIAQNILAKWRTDPKTKTIVGAAERVMMRRKK